MGLKVLEWNCDVCGRKRPDRYISVATHKHIDGYGITIEQLVNYCNDSDTCPAIAHIRSHTDIALQRLQREHQKMREQIARLHTSRLLWAFIAFVAGFVIRGAI